MYYNYISNCKEFSVVDECKNPSKYGVDCDANASCKDTPDGYLCVCASGFFDVSERFSLKAGRRCERGAQNLKIHSFIFTFSSKFFSEETDPCTSGQNDCSKNATCSSSKGTYTCQCKSGFNDVSPNKHYPGRDCRVNIPDTPSTCSGGEQKQQKSCTDGENCSAPRVDTSGGGGFVCSCPTGSHRSQDGTSCIGIILIIHCLRNVGKLFCAFSQRFLSIIKRL